MTEFQTLEDLFDEGLERYKAGEAPESLIPLFQSLCDRSSKSSVSWTCLSWLYLLTDKPNQAIKAAKKAIKLNPHDPQARINLAVALLDAGQKGVREHIDVAQQIITIAPEDIKEEVVGNIQDGFDRKPDWKSLERVKAWLFSP